MTEYWARPNTSLDLFTWGNLVGVDPRIIWGITTVNCLLDSYISTCSTHFTEAPWQRTNTMSRIGVLQRIALAELKLANYLGYFPNLEYTECEIHQVSSLEDTIRTKWSKVAMTGTRKFTQYASNVPQIREFDDPLTFGFDTSVTYTIGTADHPIPFLESCDLCDLIIMPPGLATADTVPDWLGHRIRPFEIVSFHNGILKIRIPLWVLVKRNLYFFFTTKHNEFSSVSACDPDNFWETIDLFRVSYEQPSGYITLNESYCCCPDGTCPACARQKCPICLIPVDPEAGEFKFKIITNADCWDETPCWVTLDNDCCTDLHFNFAPLCNTNCQPTRPLYVEINYLSGCGACYQADCFSDRVCPELEMAVAMLAAGMLEIVCDCPCLVDAMGYYIEDVRKIAASGSAFRTVYNGQSFTFGYTQGAVMAWDIIKHINTRLEYAVL